MSTEARRRARISWNARNPGRVSECKRLRHRRLREEVINKLGGSCVCCGESTFEFLTIDHVQRNGSEHARELKTRSTTALLKAIRNAGFPEQLYRVLCYNCNCAIGVYGVCPHQKDK